ncbi:nucleotidyl transferase AbiEii/AbiGii toxin family protein [Acrocarpospora sp. B8E8]|uniref:nucleotidyl transferase AbiEii/AbiGii toxin family protein n=1 Tax=Acrocarpospora sp. B8E8 TaxID=3153572 RepID=UPI00325E2212
MKVKIVTHAKSLGLHANMAFRSFYFSRLAARIFHHDPTGWLLKGGQALLVRYPSEARLSRDIDLQRPGTRSIQEARSALLDAAALDLQDFFRFIPTSLIEHSDEIGGAKQSFNVLLGTRKMDSIGVDFVTGRFPTGIPETVDLRSGIAMPWPDDWPQAQLYPLSDHIADKICAMYERHNGFPSSRWRDLADLLLISQREDLDGTALRIALESERLRRTGLGLDLELPGEFCSPGPAWTAGYESAARDVTGLRGCRSFAEATAAAHTFITPILGGPAPNHWDHTNSTWSFRR